MVLSLSFLFVLMLGTLARRHSKTAKEDGYTPANGHGFAKVSKRAAGRVGDFLWAHRALPPQLCRRSLAPGQGLV
ncbi:hypothetical protein DEM27_02240 [Metarhizobium album]|uniref:Uncharacterized protein n=1 Tax=Metarhizobium album TaxID=2182425 RepID=A0A2U2DXJ1_9HYPH|nr:hypothetical protein [Rhizobium album]PWE58031.1 hypothetical protein DEM27_02240 [Rhizobium album]